jgi:hypothetical protein
MSPISDEVRAKVIAELLAGAPVNATARKYKLGNATVSRLKSELSSEQLEQIGTEKRERIDQLLLASVATHLQALDNIATYVSTPEYLGAKSPESIATLYKELAVTPLSILEAAGAAGVEEDAEAAED